MAAKSKIERVAIPKRKKNIDEENVLNDELNYNSGYENVKDVEGDDKEVYVDLTVANDGDVEENIDDVYNEKNVVDDIDGYNNINNENVGNNNLQENIVDEDNDISNKIEQVDENNVKENIKKTARKKRVTTKKNAKDASNVTKRKSKKVVEEIDEEKDLFADNVDEVDTVIKADNKKTKKSKKVDKPKNITEALARVSNVEPKEEIKRPKKMLLMVALYTVVMVALVAFLVIYFTKITPVKTSEKKLMELSNKVKTDKKNENMLIDDTYIEEFNVDNVGTNERETTISGINQKALIDSLNYFSKDETIDKKDVKIDTNTANVDDKSKENVTNSVSDRVIESNKNVAVNNSVVRIAKVIPNSNFMDKLYSFATYNQYSKSQVEEMRAQLGVAVEKVQDKIFGEEIEYDDKGLRGIVYLNHKYISEYLKDYDENNKRIYDALPIVAYDNYIRNKRFGFDESTMSSKLEFSIDFNKAKDKGLYYEIPAVAYESGKKKQNGEKMNLFVLKKAKVGFSQNYLLTATLEILDTECNTKINPYFDVEDIIKENKEMIAKLKENGSDLEDMLKHTYFNHVVIDKKGYVTDIFYFS